MTKWTQTADDVRHSAKINHDLGELLGNRRIRIGLKDGRNISGQVMGFEVGNNAGEHASPWPTSWHGNVKIQTEQGLWLVEYLDIASVASLP
jgi:hypothetical protein